MEYMQVLLTNIAVMHSFLAEIDPAFVICHDFERAGEINQSSSIANFLAPNKVIAEALKNVLVGVAAGMARSPRTSVQHLPHNGADVVAARLQRKFDAFESTLCAVAS